MGYHVFEVTAGDVLNRIEAICRHLTEGGKFTDTTPARISDVEMFIDDAYYWLAGELVKHGYVLTITDTEALAVLQQIQALDAVAQIEFSQPVTDTGEPNERYKGLIARRDRLVKDYIQTDGLQRLGATKDRDKSTYLDLTGRSVDRKNTVYTNSDVVPSRFPRGFGQRKDRGRPSAGSPDNLADPNQV